MALSVDASADQRHFIVGCADHAVYHWDLGMQKCVAKYQNAHSDMVWGVKYLSGKNSSSGTFGDDNSFFSVGDDGIIQFYD